jgi:LmbE family N-acetylglucosaminyl deacetylase
VFVLGEGDVPAWVQRWKPTPEKAEILFLATHPDDELLFLGGALAWYGVEQQRSVAVAYLTKSNTTRRSEALNGLWTLGIRNYPIFGEWRDCYSRSGQAKDAYKDTGGKSKIQGWVTELYRQLKPEVVVTQDLNGEYGHPQHKMVADAATAAYSLAADSEQ